MRPNPIIRLCVAAVVRRLASGVTTAATFKPKSFDELRGIREHFQTGFVILNAMKNPWDR